jgi:pyruvate/2-oxoglutarate dehydrogenase complex dihydrolipoamide dehydrogenase (E3) component
MEQARVTVRNAFGIALKGAVDTLAPLGVYSIPTLAMVGMTEEQARAEEIDIETGRAPFTQKHSAERNRWRRGSADLAWPLR